jgi:hypothetical protein
MMHTALHHTDPSAVVDIIKLLPLELGGVVPAVGLLSGGVVLGSAEGVAVTYSVVESERFAELHMS